mmetsp:Transcript_9465/g.38720  ORF Transcript_9465/g.38720 Transcript_9465/m.38720 type:complete len:233 (-) Transcript_9465:321-1019(-)
MRPTHTARYARLASASRAWNPATPIIVPELRSKTSKTQALGDDAPVPVGRERAAQSSRNPSRHRENPASVSAPKFGRWSSSRRISPARASTARSGRRKSRRSERTTAPSDGEVAPAAEVAARSVPEPGPPAISPDSPRRAAAAASTRFLVRSSSSSFRCRLRSAISPARRRSSDSSSARRLRSRSASISRSRAAADAATETTFDGDGDGDGEPIASSRCRWWARARGASWAP